MKNVDLIVVNNVFEEGVGFDVDINIVIFILKEKIENFLKMNKSEVVKRIFDYVLIYFCKV